MAIDFKTKDVIHHIPVKFVRASLPGAKKPYYLKAVHQPELDIHGIASKADIYNITTSPKVIEEGLAAGMKLIGYLAADGYRIKTPLFTLKIRVPGEYYGSENALGEGLYPRATLQTRAEFRKYLQEKVKIEFDGMSDMEGFIGEALDEATGLNSQKLTKGNILTIQGYGLKIESDREHADETGVFFTTASGSTVKAPIVPVNEPKKLKVLIPHELETGASYTINIRTMSSSCGGSYLLKRPRKVKSAFSLTA